MTIDGTDIQAVYGLRLLELKDYFNLPERKEILPVPSFTANDIKLNDGQAKVRLLGKYADQATAVSQYQAFAAFIKGALKHSFNLTGHNLTFTGICKSGMKVNLHRRLLIIDLEITILHPDNL